MNFSTIKKLQHERAGMCFDDLTDTQLSEHLKVYRYGAFELTDAIRPCYDLHIVPAEGYRNAVYTNEARTISAPVIQIAASREKLYDLFIELLGILNDDVTCFLSSTHRSDSSDEQEEFMRDHMDLSILKSTLYDVENLLMNDGCAGISVVNHDMQPACEVSFDEHKILQVYGTGLGKVREILADYRIDHKRNLAFITEAEHLHNTKMKYEEEFADLCLQLHAESEEDVPDYRTGDDEDSSYYE